MAPCFCCIDPSLPATSAPVRFGNIADILGALVEKEPKDRKEIETPPANAGNMGSNPGQGRFHMLQGS